MAPYDKSHPLVHVQDAAENKPGHKKFVNYNLPEWVRHPLIRQSDKVAILFPGEQNHSVGMVPASVSSQGEVKRMLDAASKVFGFDLQEVMASGPVSKMSQTQYSLPLAYVANCAAYEVLKASYPKIAEDPQGIAGYSVGEYNALYAAGVITFEQGLSLVKLRAEALERAAQDCEMVAMAFSGLSFDKVDGMCTKAKKKDAEADPQLEVVAHNGTSQYCAAGRKSTILQLEEASKKESGKGNVQIRLLPDQNHAAGTPLLAQAAVEVGKALDRMLPGMNPPRCELYLNATGWRVPAGTEPAKFVQALKEQLTCPIMWEGSVDQMLRWGIRDFYECGPGRSLKSYMQDTEFIEESPLVILKPVEKVINVIV
jgi:[acyl-carrier-protein] S-malonyltransferase